MATAKKNKSGKWTCLIYDYTNYNGKRIYKRFTANTKKEAELLAAQYKAGRIHETDLLTVKQCLNEHISLKSSVLSPSSIKGYRNIERVLNKEYPAFMSRSIHSIRKNDLQSLVSDLATKKSPKTVRNYYGLLKAISDHLGAFKVTLPQVIDYEPYIPSEGQILALLDYVKGKEIELPVMLGAYCMMRRGEICALTMDDVNFKNKTINIRHSKVLDDDREWIIKAPKTKKSKRIIKIPDFVLDKIKEKGYITSYNPDTLTDRFEDILEDAGLPHFRFHDLRHFACSVFHAEGIPMAYVQKYGGWSTMNTIIKIYQHCLPEKEDEVFNHMNEYFSISYNSK